MLPRLMGILCMAVAVGAIGAGCGGGSSGSFASSIDRAEFIKRANAICERDREARLDATGAYAGEHRDEPLTKVSRDSFIPAALPLWERELDALRALGAPSSDGKQVNQIFAGFEGWVEGTKQVKGGSNAALNRQIAATVEMARRYGLDSCTYG